MLLPIAQGGHSVVSDLTLDITSNASEVNILTLAQAAGYSVSDSTNIIVNVASGVTVSGSSTYAMRTGALNADSNLTINVASGAAITGFTGANGSHGSCPGGAGSAGGDGIFFETSTGGSAVLSVGNSGTVSGGGGGGGGGGRQGGRQAYGPDDTDKIDKCAPNGNVTVYTGSVGSQGSAGGLGQAGTSGGSGTFGGGDSRCVVYSPCAGGAGGAAGFSVRKNSRTVSIGGSGTYNGSTA